MNRLYLPVYQSKEMNGFAGIIEALERCRMRLLIFFQGNLLMNTGLPNFILWAVFIIE